MGILIIENSTDNIDKIKYPLDLHVNLPVHSAFSFKEAVIQLSSYKIELILINLDLPYNELMVFCENLKQHPIYRNLVIIGMVTEENENLNQMVTNYVYDYIKKPISIKELYTRVQAGLRFSDLLHSKKELNQNYESPFYQSLFELNSNAIFSLDLKGRFTRVNGATSDLTGYSKKELLAMGGFSELFTAEIVPSVMKKYLGVLSGKTDSFQTKLQNKSGNEIDIDIYAIPIKEENSIIGVIGIAIDITNEKQEQDQLSRNEKNYREIVEFSPNAVFIHDRKEIKYLNSKAIKLLGGDSKKQFIGKKVSDFVHPEYKVELVNHVTFHGRETSIQNLKEIKLIRINGDGFIAGYESKRISYNGKRYILTVLRDITSYKQLENDLKATIQELKDMKIALDRSSIVEITTSNGEIIYVNNSFCDITGYVPTEIVGNSHRVLNAGYHPKGFFEEFWKTIKQGRVWKGEIKNKRKNGSYYWVDTTVVPVFEKNKKIKHFVTVRKDITPRKEFEQSQNEQLDLAKDIQQHVLPNSIFNNEISIQAFYLPSDNLSGDMYYWVQLTEHRYAVMVLDIMGHGVSSALISMSVRAILNRVINNIQDPIEVITRINEHLFSLFKNKQKNVSTYLTAIYVVVDTIKKEVEYINCGHPDGYLVESESSTLHSLNKGSIPIGLIQKMPIQKGKVKYSGQARILLYTDGLNEIIGKDQHESEEIIKGKVISTRFQKHSSLLQELSYQLIFTDNRPDDICITEISLLD